MARLEYAKDIMAKPIEWVTPGETLRVVARRMLETAFSQLPVMKSERNVGRITEDMIRDELERAEGVDIAIRKVSDLEKYGRPFQEVPLEMPLRELIRRLRDDQALLVKDGFRLENWGIVTRADVLRVLL